MTTYVWKAVWEGSDDLHISGLIAALRTQYYTLNNRIFLPIDGFSNFVFRLLLFHHFNRKEPFQVPVHLTLLPKHHMHKHVVQNTLDPQLFTTSHNVAIDILDFRLPADSH